MVLCLHGAFPCCCTSKKSAFNSFIAQSLLRTLRENGKGDFTLALFERSILYFLTVITEICALHDDKVWQK